MAIYTKTGDKGTTGTFDGKRISKSSKLIRAIGAIDELNSFLGIIGGLTEIQKNLFTINGILTGANLKLPATATKVLEKKIDEIEGTLPVQKNFLIYGGTRKASELYFARALARRAEREIVELVNGKSMENEKWQMEILIYINRLSDYLFMKAKEENFGKGIKESIWKASK